MVLEMTDGTQHELKPGTKLVLHKLRGKRHFHWYFCVSVKGEKTPKNVRVRNLLYIRPGRRI